MTILKTFKGRPSLTHSITSLTTQCRFYNILATPGLSKSNLDVKMTEVTILTVYSSQPFLLGPLTLYSPSTPNAALEHIRNLSVNKQQFLGS